MAEITKRTVGRLKDFEKAVSGEYDDVHIPAHCPYTVPNKYGLDNLMTVDLTPDECDYVLKSHDCGVINLNEMTPMELKYFLDTTYR